jgi:hypothetical protein
MNYLFRLALSLGILVILTFFTPSFALDDCAINNPTDVTSGITEDQAKNLAEDYIKTVAQKSKFDLVLIPDATKEYKFGWVFSYNTKQYLETHDFKKGLFGNGPIIITRTGTVKPEGASVDLIVIIDSYCKLWNATQRID